MYSYKLSNKYNFYSKHKNILNLVRKNLIKHQSKYYKFLYPEWTHYLRDIEIGLIASKLNKNQKILEIGSGDGYVAYILKEKYGLDVIASDLEPRYPQYIDVLKVDGQSTEFQDKTYDVIISLHVLEHIEDIDKAMQEFKRLLKDDGIMLHLVPSTMTIFITTIMQPLSYFRAIYLYINGYFLSKYQPFKNKNILRFIKDFIFTLNPMNIFWGSGHGVYNRINCFRYWKIKEWDKVFERNNLDVLEVKNSNILNSMHKIFPFKFLKFREFLSKKWGGSANLFIVRKKF